MYEFIAYKQNSSKFAKNKNKNTYNKQADWNLNIVLVTDKYSFQWKFSSQTHISNIKKIFSNSQTSKRCSKRRPRRTQLHFFWRSEPPLPCLLHSSHACKWIGYLFLYLTPVLTVSCVCVYAYNVQCTCQLLTSRILGEIKRYPIPFIYMHGGKISTLSFR